MQALVGCIRRDGTRGRGAEGGRGIKEKEAKDAETKKYTFQE